MHDQLQTPEDIQAVILAEQVLAEAHVQLDMELIDYLLHPDYVIIQPGGQIESRQQVLDSYRAGDRRWDAACSDQLDVRIYGDSAVVVGRWTASGRNGLEEFDYSARFLSFWLKENGRWRNVAAQSTEIIFTEG